MLLKPEELEKVLTKLRPWCLVAAANEWDMLMSHVDSLSEGYKDTSAKLQYVLDLWDAREPFADGGFTFPDGDFWPTTRFTQELEGVLNASGTI